MDADARYISDSCCLRVMKIVTSQPVRRIEFSEDSPCHHKWGVHLFLIIYCIYIYIYIYIYISEL
jgi:hypothetical protein